MKKGFTLAEVLITLSVIGVIAAMTLPTLSTNALRAQAGPAFMKTMNTLEQANMLALSENNARTLSRACDSNGNGKMDTSLEYINCISPFLNARDINDTTTQYRSPNSNEIVTLGRGMALKDGTTFGNYNKSYWKKNAGWEDRDPKTGEFEKVYYTTMFVDINGPAKGPNMLSRDTFAIMVNEETGKVFASGSDSFVTDLNSRSSYTDWGEYQYKQNTYSWRKGCNQTSVIAPGTCSGSIADNNGRIIYPWN